MLLALEVKIGKKLTQRGHKSIRTEALCKIETLLKFLSVELLDFWRKVPNGNTIIPIKVIVMFFNVSWTVSASGKIKGQFPDHLN